MADLIYRDAAIKEVEEWAEHGYELIHWTGIKAMLETQPAVDAEPVKRGKWLTCDDGWGDVHYQCSECGQEWCLNDGTPEENGMNYCPHCWAKMEVGE